MFEEHAGVVDELVLPDLHVLLLSVLDHITVPFAVIRDGMQHGVKHEALRRDVESRHQREEDERRELCDDVVAQHLLALRLGICHPLALEGKVADVVACEEDCEVLPSFECDGHGTPPGLVFDSEYLSTSTLFREHLSPPSTTSISLLSSSPTTH